MESSDVTFAWALRRDNSTYLHVFFFHSFVCRWLVVFPLPKIAISALFSVESAALAHSLRCLSMCALSHKRNSTDLPCSMLHTHLERRWQLVSKHEKKERKCSKNSHTWDEYKTKCKYNIRKCSTKECRRRHHGCYPTSYRFVSILTVRMLHSDCLHFFGFLLITIGRLQYANEAEWKANLMEKNSVFRRQNIGGKNEKRKKKWCWINRIDF